MPSSDARINANRQNAMKSTGPKTPEGKEISRSNALKHGLSSLVVVTGEEVGEVARRVEWLQDSLAPDDDPLTLILARQVAFLSVQLERGYRCDAALAAERGRNAEDTYDDARRTAAEQHFGYIGAEPMTHHRRLMATVEGVDLLIQKMEELSRIGRPGGAVWESCHGITFDLCTGRYSGSTPLSRCAGLTDLIVRNDPWGIDPAEVEGMTWPARQAWAIPQIHQLIAAELDRLRAHRATFNPARHAASRAQADQRSLVVVDKETQLARRYQNSASHALSRFIDQIRTRRRDIDRKIPPPELTATRVEAAIMPDIPPPSPGLASFCGQLDQPIDASTLTIGKPPTTPIPLDPTTPEPPKPSRYTP